MSILKFIWFAVLALIVVQFVGAINNDGSIPANFVGNILIFLALSAIIILGWVFGRLRKKITKQDVFKPPKSKNRNSSKKDEFQTAMNKPEADDPLMSILEKGDMYGDGIDADEIPGTVGEFGLDINNPIPVKSVLGANQYLNELTFTDGTKVIYERVGSTTSTYVKHPIDIYQLSLENGEKVCEIYFSPYHKRNSSKKPDFGKINNEQEQESDYVITSPFEPIPEMQSADGVRTYLSKLSKISNSKIFIELSNVLSAKHNLMMLPTPINEYAEKQALVTDLTDKATLICIKTFGQDAISNFTGNDFTVLNELINKFDEQVAQQDLAPEQHGAALLRKIGAVVSPEM